MNKSGLTLVELVASLVILSIIALIVTPNIMVSVKQYQKQLYDSTLETVKNSAKNWAADNIENENFPVSDESSLIITLEELQEAGYVKDEIKNPVDGGYFDNKGVFVIITCQLIVDEFDSHESNYKYTYEVYKSLNEYIISSTKSYAEENNLTIDQTVLLSTLVSGNYISSNIVKTDGTIVIINPSSILIKVTSVTNKTETLYDYNVVVSN